MANYPRGTFIFSLSGQFIFHHPTTGAFLGVEYHGGDGNWNTVSLDTTGNYFLAEGSGGEATVLSAQLALLGQQTLGDAKGAATNYVGTFYTIDGGTIKKLSPTDASTLQSWTIGAGFDALAVAPDDSVAYFGNNGQNNIKVYNLVASTGPTTFATETGCTFAFGGGLIFAMRNGEVVAGWMDEAFSPAHPFIAHYDASGTQLHRYNVGLEAGGQDFIVSLAPALDNLSIWAAVYLQAPQVVRVSQIRISDGVILSTWDVVPNTHGGPYNYDNASIAIVQVPIGGVVSVAPPLAPQTPCTPAAAIGSGGKGNSGCTVGGIGRTPSYAGAYGTVANHADPVDGELLAGKEGQGVEPYIELIHTDDISSIQTIYRRAFVELGDSVTFDGGRKARGLLSLGAVQNSLGNEQGMPEASGVDLIFSDADDRFIRTLVMTQDVEGDELRIKLASDALRNL